MEKHFAFEDARIKSVKADFVKREVVISVSIPLNEVILRERSELALVAFEEHRVTLNIDVEQLPLFKMGP